MMDTAKSFKFHISLGIYFGVLTFAKLLFANRCLTIDTHGFCLFHGQVSGTQGPMTYE